MVRIMKSIILWILLCLLLVSIISCIYLFNRNKLDPSEMNLPEKSDAMQAYFDIYGIPNLSESDRLKIMTDEVLDKYPNSDAALEVRLKLIEKEYWDKHVEGDVSNLVFDQGLYREKKKLLELYPNSSGLLTHLGSLGYLAYPEEVVEYCQRAIVINPTNIEAYKYLGLAYTVLDKFDMALICFEHGKNLLAELLLVELNKPIPFKNRSLGIPSYYASDINFAKSYLRDLGFDPGKDVNYDLEKIRKKQHGFFDRLLDRPKPVFGIMGLFELSDGESDTVILGLFRLDLFVFYIEEIESGSPTFGSYMRVPVEMHPLKELKD